MYKSSYKCSECKSQFEKITKNFPKKDPNCPKCRRNNRVNSKSCVSDKTHNLDADSRVQEMIDSKRPPSMGKSNFTKAMDATAEIVMKDYNMTDLQDNLRAGDSMAPKLQGSDATGVSLESRVDQVFKPQANKVMGMQGANSLNKALTGQINAGKYASQSGQRDITQRAQNSGYKVPTNVLYEHQPERPS